MPASNAERNKATYRRFVELLNTQNFNALPEVVDPDRYREDCIGFTGGWVDLTDATSSLRRALVGIPDLTAEIEDCVADDHRIYARLTVRGTNTGRLFGLPPTRRAYQVNMFDYALFDGGKIVERIQQTDSLSQMRQLYTPALASAAVAAVLSLTGTAIALRRRSRRP
ncbi:MAG: ester cyclase [Egibacteraceae bacterium]